MRRVPAGLAVLVMLLASVAPALAVAPTFDEATAPSFMAPATNAVQERSAQEDAAGAPPDPGSDRLGWENGYWHNESVDVDQSDGVSQAELEALVARTMARVEHIRGLEFEQTVPVEIVSREEFRQQGANRSHNESLRAFDNGKYEALLLVGENEDALNVQRTNSGSNVLGYYSPRENAIVVVANNESAPKVDEYTLAHELVHALQDQHYDLSTIRSQTRDGANANNGIVEGDAGYVQHLYERRCTDQSHEWNGTCVRPPSSEAGGGGAPANMGVYFLKFQPYSDGPKFVQQLHQRGGWEAVNRVYANPPASTEQVIHPEKYGQDAPANVSLADEHGENWERVRPPNQSDHGEVGQAGVASMFVYPLYHGGNGGRLVEPNTWLNYTDGNQVSSFDPLNYGFSLAEGWDGDRLHVYRNGNGETAYVWRIVWDSNEDAMEFQDGYIRLLNYWGAEQVGPNTYRISDGAFADAFHVVLEGDTVTIVNAPTVDQLTEVRGSLDAQATTATPSSTGGTDDGANGSGSPTGTDSTETDVPGFAAVTAVVALLAAVLLVTRR